MNTKPPYLKHGTMDLSRIHGKSIGSGKFDGHNEPGSAHCKRDDETAKTGGVVAYYDTTGTTSGYYGGVCSGDNNCKCH